MMGTVNVWSSGWNMLHELAYDWLRKVGLVCSRFVQYSVMSHI